MSRGVLFLLNFQTVFGLLEPPNVLFIVIDDLRTNLGIYGDPLAKTPNMDFLASRGYLFEHTYAQQSLCGPSRASFMTSRRPDSTKLYDLHSHWRDFAGNFTTISQYFKENGYLSYSVGKIHHPGPVSNNTNDMPYSWSLPARGYEVEFKGDCQGDNSTHKHDIYCPIDFGAQPSESLNDIHNIKVVRKILRSHLDSEVASPFFLAMGFFKPHVPFQFPMEYLSLYPLESIKPVGNPRPPIGMPPIAFSKWKRFRTMAEFKHLTFPGKFGIMPELEQRRIRQHYYAATAFIDHQVGKLIENLVQLDSHRNTIVSIFSDHGFSLGEHGEISKFTNFEEATKVPWVVLSQDQTAELSNFKAINPLLPASSTLLNTIRPRYKYHHPVELVDTFPTLVDMAFLPRVPQCPRNRAAATLVPTCTEGRSRARWIADPEGFVLKSPAYAFSQYPRSTLNPKFAQDSPALSRCIFMGYSVRDNRFRLTEWIRFDPKNIRPDWNLTVGLELYDYFQDPAGNDNAIDNECFANEAMQLRSILREKFSY